MVLKFKVGRYQLHKESKNVQNKEIFLYFIFLTNSFFNLFSFYTKHRVKNILFRLLFSPNIYIFPDTICLSRL